MISATIRNIIRCGWWLAITALVVVAAAWSVLEHYLNAANALELLGTEQKPLSADSLLGTVLSAFLPQAALPQAMALTISLIEALAFFFIANTLMDILGLIRHYRTSRKHDKPEEAEEAVWRLIENGFGMAMMGGLLVYGILWDLDIFRYRSMAGAYGYDTPLKAAQQLPSWAEELRENGSWAAVQMARVGAWGYLSFTAAGCVLLDLVIRKLDDAFSRLMRPIDQWYESRLAAQAEEADAVYDDEQDEQPVGDPIEESVTAERPAAEPAYEPERPTQTTNGHANGTHVTREETPMPEMATVSADRTAPQAAQNGHGAPHNGASSRPLFDPEVASRPLTPSRPEPVVTPREREVSDLRDVLGGAAGERVGLATAVTQPDRYYVNLATGQVWNREAWRRLHTGYLETNEEERS